MRPPRPLVRRSKLLPRLLPLLSGFLLSLLSGRAHADVHALISTPLTLSRISFTSGICTTLLTSLTLSSYPGPLVSGSDPARVLDGSSVILNTPTNDRACEEGSLTLADSGIPANQTAPVTSYNLFLRGARDVLPRRFFSYASAPVSSAIRQCATSGTAEIPDLALSSLLLFTAKDNATVLSTFAAVSSKAAAPQTAGQSDPNSERLLAEGVVYIALEFRVPEGGDPVSVPGGTDATTQFHCFLASDARSANAAAERGIREGLSRGAAVEEEKEEEDGEGDGGDGQGDGFDARGARRPLSAGEAVGIAGGTVVAAVTVVTIFVSRRKRNRGDEPNVASLPRL